MVKIYKLEKIGTIEIVPVRRSGRRYYLPLRKGVVDALGLKVGDRLEVQINGRLIPPGGEETG